MGVKFNPLIFNGLDFGGSSGGGGGGANTTLSNLTSPTALNQSLNFDNGLTINDSNTDAAIDPNSRILIDTAHGSVSIDWENRDLKDIAENNAITWNTRQLRDVNETVSLNWDTRTLVDNSTHTIATWTGPNTFAMSVPLLASNGTASLPSLGFGSETNTGIYRPTTNQLAVSIAGTQRMLFGLDTFGGGGLTLPDETAMILVGGSLSNLGVTTPPSTITAASSLYNAGFGAVVAGANIPVFMSKSSNGTLAAPTAVTSAKNIGANQYIGHNGTTYVTGAQFLVQATENWTSSVRGTKVFLSNTTTGTNNLVNTLTLNGDNSATFASTVGSTGFTASSSGVFTTVSATGAGTGVWPFFLGQNSRGTIASPTALQSGDILGTFSLRGYDGSAFSATKGTAIFSKATENWSGTNHGSEVVIQTTPTGSGGTIFDAVKVTNDGSLAILVAGGGLQIKTGSNARIGTSTLVAGTVVVSNTSVTANTKIIMNQATAGGVLGALSYTKVNGTSFTINSSSGADTSTVDWVLIEGN